MHAMHMYAYRYMHTPMSMSLYACTTRGLSAAQTEGLDGGRPSAGRVEATNLITISLSFSLSLYIYIYIILHIHIYIYIYIYICIYIYIQHYIQVVVVEVVVAKVPFSGLFGSRK